MNELLKPGQVVTGETSQQPCAVEQFLGGGGQGEVYRANWGGKPFALKWYFPHTATEAQRAGLQDLVKTPPPSDNFLWPLEIASAAGVAGFGYLMRLRESRFKSLQDLMKGRIDPTFRALVTAGLQLADSFRSLHAAGLCYQDISFGNAFFDSTTGEVLVCDNDNVRPNRSGVCGVLGTPDFMAPEIVRREGMPTTQTDLHSLAVLLFYMLHVSHPLYGKKVLNIRCLDLPARELLLGKQPVFIFDPNDPSNEAVNHDAEAGATAIKYWRIYPQFVRDAFTKAFTTGLKDPQNGRVLEGEWRDVLARLRDSIFYCGHCGKENFYDHAAVQSAVGGSPRCIQCGREARLPYRIRVGRNIVMLTHETKLYPHHVDSQRPFDFSAVVGEVAQHPQDPTKWGLRNTTAAKWVITGADGVTRDVEPGKAAVLSPNLKINFGKVEGEVRY